MKLRIWDKIKLGEIRRDAKRSLRYRDFNANKESKVYILYLYVLPVLISVALLSLGVFLEKEVAYYLITGISIFAGLFFGLLFVVTDKYNQKRKDLKDLLVKGDEEAKGYVQRYQNFSVTLIRQIAFTIILAGTLILSILVIYMAPQLPQCNVEWYGCVKLAAKYLINGVIYYWGGVQFLLFLLLILSNTYIMLLEDIHSGEK